MQLIDKERWKAHQSASVAERRSQSKRRRTLQDILQAVRETVLTLDDAHVKGCDLVPGSIASNYMICIGFVSLFSFLLKNNLESVRTCFPKTLSMYWLTNANTPHFNPYILYRLLKNVLYRNRRRKREKYK
jgi:hypothetical protein